MRFAARADMDLPIDIAFDRLSDFAAFERGARKRGIAVDRLELRRRRSLAA